jgi:hypothetical protein
LLIMYSQMLSALIDLSSLLMPALNYPY